MKGRLRAHFKFWSHSLGASQTPFFELSKRDVIPFITGAHKAFFSNNSSAIRHADFVSEAIQELTRSGCMTEVVIRPHMVNPLSVSIQSSGKKRLILDLRHVNNHVWKEKFKFEGIRVACNYQVHLISLCSNLTSNLGTIILTFWKITKPS